ncbi:chondroitin AC/alginate lyase [Abortiporus biennis]|nr:chondroitin AC/alginate lyase [Abortiporus biennis]
MAPKLFPSPFLLAVTISVCYVSTVHSLTDYANIFLSPKNLSSIAADPAQNNAESTIRSWAGDLLVGGPYNVTGKLYTPPSGDKHDFMSFQPYAWPDCSSAGNTTELTQEQIWSTCQYVTKDGQINPDSKAVTDQNNFQDFANAVFYGALSYVVEPADSPTQWDAQIAKMLKAWFLDPETSMNPNLQFAQMRRGPGNEKGTHEGILDLKCMAKVVSAVLILRDRQSANWPSDVDGQLNEWAKTYIQWLQTADIALEEAAATNNHGSFYYNQLAALQILIGDNDAAKSTLEKYFTGIYLGQIDANGDQPLESARTRPFHYRAYNLAAMITNARLGEYVGYDAWDLKTTNGGTIKGALDYAIQQDAGSEDDSELYPWVAAIATHYGDPDNTYANYIKKILGNGFYKTPVYFWDKVAAASDIHVVTSTSTSASASKTSSKNSKAAAESGASKTAKITFLLGLGTAAMAMVNLL